MNYLGTVQGGSGLTSNVAGGASLGATFAISPNIKALYLVPDTPGLSFELFGQTSPTGAALPPRTQGAPLVASALNGPFARVCGYNPCSVVVFNPTGQVVRVAVYASPILAAGK